MPCYARSVQALHLLVLVGVNPGSVLGVAVLQLTAEKESQLS
jgi:predicted RNase H-like nuclease (RuvC/YqgF family)